MSETSPITKTNNCCGGACMTKSSNALLTWKNPQKSAKVYLATTTVLLLVRYINVINVALHIACLGLLGSAAVEYTSKQIIGEGLVTKFKPKYSTIVAKFTNTYAEHAVKILSNVEIFLQDLVYSKNIDQTFRFGVIAYIAYKLTSILSLWTLLFVTNILAFSVPFFYLTYETEINQLYAQYSKVAKDKLVELYNLLLTKAKPTLDIIDEKIKPVTSFIKAKLPVRTAGTTVGESLKDSTTTSTSATTTADVPLSSVEPKVEKPSIDQVDQAVVDESTPITNPLSEIVDDVKPTL